MKENANTSQPITDVSIATDPVGIFYDKSRGLEAIAVSDATRPTLSNDASRKSFITFNGTSQRLRIANTQKYLKPIHAAGSNAYCFMTWVKINAADGVLVLIADNSEYSTTGNSGFSLYVNTSNQLVYKVNYSSGGNYKINKTTTATIKSSDGHVPVIIYSEGNGANKFHIQIGNNTEELATVNAVGSTNDCFTNLNLGCNSNETTFGSISLGTFFMMNRIPTVQEISDFKLYNRVPDTTNWFAPKKKFDFNDSSFGFADTGETTPITNNTAFRVWRSSLTSPFGDMNRKITTAAAGTSAVWKTSQQNGKAALDYDGVDDNSLASEAFLSGRGGRYTVKIIFKNDDSVNGSHLMQDSDYLTQTGSTYASGTYFTAHAVGGESGGQQTPKNGGEGVNIIYIRRDGPTFSTWNGNKTKVTNTINGLMRFADIGNASIVGWEKDGLDFKVEEWAGLLTDAYIEADIDAENAAYNI